MISTDSFKFQFIREALVRVLSRENMSDQLQLAGRDMDLDLLYKNAISGGNIDIGYLEEKRPHLDQILTPTKNTVLHIYIACQQEVENVKKILELCPPLLFQPNDSGDTALHVAARHGRDGIVDVLLQEAAKSDPYGPHHRGDLEKGMPLREMQMLIRTTNKQRDTALHEAVRFNHEPVVKLLTEKDPEFIYSANDDGDTPLYLAAKRGYGELVSLILEKCTYPANTGRNGRTALHAAVICKHEGMTRELLEYSTDHNMALTKVVDGQGWTPLHFAAFYGYSSIAKVLLESDKSAAYVGDKDYNRTPLHLAALEGHEAVMEDLLSYSPGCCELVDHKGRNLLHYAIKWRRHPIVDSVLKRTWLSNNLLNRKDADGNTPHYLLALSSQDARTDHFIGDAGVDKMAFNKENLNALDNILKNYFQGILEKNGAKPAHHRDEEIRYGGRRPFGEIEEKKVGKGYDEILKEIKDAHLVVATLIATVTFTAGFTMPGGYRNEVPGEGFAVLTRNAAFKAFVITDTLAMALSTCSVLMHFYLAIAKQTEIPETIPLALSFTMYALISMLIAFITGIYAALGDCFALGVAACVLTCTIIGAAFFFLTPASKSFRKAVLKFAKERREHG